MSKTPAKRASEQFVTCLRPFARRRDVGNVFGPSHGLERATTAIRAGLGRAEAQVIAEELGAHLSRHRASGTFTTHDWQRAVGATPVAVKRAGGFADPELRTALDQSLGLLDTFGLEEGDRKSPWRNDEDLLFRMVAYHGVVWLRMVTAGVLPMADPDTFAAKADSRLRLTQIRSSPNPVKSHNDGNMREAMTQTERFEVGSVIPVGQLTCRVIRTISASDARSGSSVYEVASESGSDERVRCALKVPNMPMDPPSLAAFPHSAFVMRPTARVTLEDGRSVDLLPLAETDLFAWWRSRYLSRQQVLGGREVAVLAAPMTAALRAMHTGLGGTIPLVHGDIKLSQFLLGSREQAALQLSDLDLAVPAASVVSTAGTEDGTTAVPARGHTLGYLPPAPDTHLTSRRRDTWALATCWHMLLTNRHPAEVALGRELNDVDRFRAVQAGQFEVSSDLDDGWVELLRTLLTSQHHRPRPSEVLQDVLGLYEPTKVNGLDAVGKVPLDDERHIVTYLGGPEDIRTELLAVV